MNALGAMLAELCVIYHDIVGGVWRRLETGVALQING